VTAVPARKGGWWVAVTAARVRTSYHKKLLVLQSSGIQRRRVRLAALLVTPREAVYPAIRRRSRPGVGAQLAPGVIGRAEYNRKTAAYYRAVSRLKRRALLTSRGMGLWITDGGMRAWPKVCRSVRSSGPMPCGFFCRRTQCWRIIPDDMGILRRRSWSYRVGYVASSKGCSRLVSINSSSSLR
jgi:hypothetical protein